MLIHCNECVNSLLVLALLPVNCLVSAYQKASKGLANGPLTLQLLAAVHGEPAAEEKHVNRYTQLLEYADKCTLEERQCTFPLLVTKRGGGGKWWLLCMCAWGLGGAGRQEQKEKDRMKGSRWTAATKQESEPSPSSLAGAKVYFNVISYYITGAGGLSASLHTTA